MKRVFVCEKDKLTDSFWGPDWRGIEPPKCMICHEDMKEVLEVKEDENVFQEERK